MLKDLRIIQKAFNTIKLKVDYYYDFNEIIKRESFGSDKSFEEDKTY